MDDEIEPARWITTKEAAELIDYHPVQIQRPLRK
jgi:hypothetical protein